MIKKLFKRITYILNEIDIKKKELRAKYLLIRDKINNKEEKSNKIFNKIIRMEEFRNAKVVAIYKSFKSEVDTSKLIDFSLNEGKIVALPRIEKNEMKFYRISSLNKELTKNKFGIEEPQDKKENLINKNSFDLIIVPGICFDIEKNRLGFGGGYYDRYLSNTLLKTIGICFEEQILYDGLLPISNTDIKIGKIITDKSFY